MTTIPPASNSSSPSPTRPLLYTLFFLYIEPIATAAGAYYAFFQQQKYLDLTYQTTAFATPGVSTREQIILLQLANLYLVFALNEALVLRATDNVRVWKTLLLGLLIADFGHVWSVNAVGWGVYWRVWEWNEMYWGNLGFVYVGAAMRVSFLLGLGFEQQQLGRTGTGAGKVKR